MAYYASVSFDPDSVASNSDVASSAMDLAAAASSAVAAKKNILYNTTPADTVDDGFTGSFVASGVLARGQLGYVKTAGTVAKANANSAATASGLLVMLLIPLHLRLLCREQWWDIRLGTGLVESLSLWVAPPEV
jgi:hypothetical protein